MLNDNFIKTNKSKAVVVLLILSLLANFYLTHRLYISEHRSEIIKRNEYSSYFGALTYYGNSLENLVSAESQSEALEREIMDLRGHSFNLLEQARVYTHLLVNKEQELSTLIWELAVHIHEVTFQPNGEIMENLVNLQEFSEIINEIVKLENQTRIEMLRNNRQFSEQEMHTVLHPKVEKAKESARNILNQEKTLSSLILHKERIDLMWIVEGESSAIKIKDKEFISQVIGETEEIKVSLLSSEEEKAFIPKFFNGKGNIISIDFHEELSGDPAYGRMLIDLDGTIVAVDTMTDQSSKRTVSYLALNKYPELYKWISEKLQN